jgi:hypothetical protein
LKLNLSRTSQLLSNRAAVIAIWLLLAVSLVLAPLLIAAIVIDVDSNRPLAQKAWVRAAEPVLFFSSLSQQLVAAGLFLNRLKGRFTRIITMLQFLGLFAACSAGSFLGGVVIDVLTERWLIRLAFELFGSVKG